MQGNRDSKKPWIPPPAKTAKKFSYLAHTQQLSGNSNESFDSVQKDSSSPSKKSSQVYVKITKEDLESLTELHQDLKLMRQHHQVLMSLSEFLQRSFSLNSDGMDSAGGMISRAVLSIQEFFTSFQDFEAIMSDLDCCSKESEKFLELPQFLCTCRMSKDLTILKALKAHEDTTSVFQYILDSQKLGDISSVVKEQEILKRKVEDYENHLMSRGSQLMHMENELSLSQARQKSLEAKIAHLQTELDHKDALIEKLKMSLNEQSTQMKGIAENEKLIQIIEELQSKNEAEKETLKRALKHQTHRAEHNERETSNLQQKLVEQEHAKHQLACERDRWKADLTALNNKFKEVENQKLSVEAKNSALKNQLVMLSSSEQLVEQLKNALEEKDSMLESASELNNSLKEDIHSLDEKYMHVLNELKELKSNLRKPNSSSQIVQTNEHDMACESTSSVVKVNRSTETHDTLREMEKSLENLREKYDAEIKEKGKLLNRLDVLESKFSETSVKKTDSEVLSQARASLWSRSYDQHMRSEMGSQATFNEAELIRLEDELNDKNQRLKCMEKSSIQLEKKYTHQIRELKSNLDRISLSYENLQKYVKLLRSSYTSVFGSSS